MCQVKKQNKKNLIDTDNSIVMEGRGGEGWVEKGIGVINGDGRINK